MKKKGPKRFAIPSKCLAIQKRHKFGGKKPRKVGVQEMVSPHLRTGTGASEMRSGSQPVVVTVHTSSEGEVSELDNDGDHKSDS